MQLSFPKSSDVANEKERGTCSSSSNFSQREPTSIERNNYKSPIPLNPDRLRELHKMSEGTGIHFITKSQLCPEEEYFKNSTPNIISPKEQINSLRKFMGLNVSEIAEILQHTRTTVYEWLKSNNPKLRPANQARLEQVYKICVYWEEKKLGRLNSYTRKAIIEDQSLFNLLSKDIINQALIYKALDCIANHILTMREKESTHENLLKSQGFKETNKDERRNNLDDFIQDMS